MYSKVVYRWFSHDVTKIQPTKLSILLRFYFHDALERLKTNIHKSFRFERVLGFVIEYASISIPNLYWWIWVKLALIWILATVFAYLPPFISQILDFIYWTVLIFILIYFEWRDTENQQCYKRRSWVGSSYVWNVLYSLSTFSLSKIERMLMSSISIW